MILKWKYPGSPLRRAVTMEAVTCNHEYHKNISTRPSSSLFINISFLCFYIRFTIFHKLMKLLGPGVDCEDKIPRHWLVFCNLLAWRFEPLISTTSFMMFVYSFQRFSGSCARYLLLYYYKPQQIGSLQAIIIYCSRKIGKNMKLGSIVPCSPLTTRARRVCHANRARVYSHNYAYSLRIHWM